MNESSDESRHAYYANQASKQRKAAVGCFLASFLTANLLVVELAQDHNTTVEVVDFLGTAAWVGAGALKLDSARTNASLAFIYAPETSD